MIFYAFKHLLGPEGDVGGGLLRGRRCKCIRKSMLHRCYCIKTFCHSKTSEKILRKIPFSVPILARKATLPRYVLKTPLPGQMLPSFWRQEITFLTVHVTDDDVRYCDGPGMLICKTTKPCINSGWIALLIRGFVTVKTWLLIACSTAFYAIIYNKGSNMIFYTLTFAGPWGCWKPKPERRLFQLLPRSSTNVNA